MKLITLVIMMIATSNAFAGESLRLTSSSGNTMIEISGAAAAQLYADLKVTEDTSGSDEDGAPQATKTGDSVFCSKISKVKFYCVMYMDQKTGKITAD